MKVLFLALLAGALALPASAQSRRDFRPGLEVGYFRFDSSRTSGTFGGNGISISPAFGSFRSGTRRGVTQLDFGVNISQSNSNTLVLVPIGVRYTKALSDGLNRPYIGASVDGVPAYSKIETLGLNGKVSFAAGASAFAGVNFSRRFNLEARFFAVSKVRGFDPSHFQIAAGVRF